MKYFATFGAVCAFSLSALASQAQADIYHLTQTGTVGSGIDTRGLFGGDGADLTGRAYSVTFTFDSTLLSSFAIDEPSFQARQYSGDIGIAEIIIDGASYSFDVGGFNQFIFYNLKFDPSLTSGWAYVTSATMSGAGGSVALSVGSATNYLGSLDLGEPYTYTLSDADRAFDATSNYWDGGDFRFAFRAETMSLSSEPGTLAPVGEAPEPASWAIMIIGFAGMGSTLRRRRRAFTA